MHDGLKNLQRPGSVAPASESKSDKAAEDFYWQESGCSKVAECLRASAVIEQEATCFAYEKMPQTGFSHLS